MVSILTSETVELKFDQEEIDKAEDEYKKLHLDPAQQDMVDSITKIMSDLVPLSEAAVKGFTWKVMSNWQRMRRITVAELSNRPLRDRIDAAKEMIKQAKKYYVSLLEDATPKQREIFERKFDTILKQSSELLRN